MYTVKFLKTYNSYCSRPLDKVKSKPSKVESNASQIYAYDTVTSRHNLLEKKNKEKQREKKNPLNLPF